MSTTSFRSRIRESIANETLQKALDANAERRLKGRAAAFESIPDWSERRQRAHEIRTDVIERLNDYLAQFIGNLEKNGVIVHRAQDAAEAIQMILDISQEVKREKGKGDILIAKSKSMVSEEIALNHILEKHDIKVVETDLGEYIVQLRHERPSHIITPAVHLTRAQVAKLFQEKLGTPYMEDIPVLTATARKVLREVFLTADIGFSGVNFGVAETGALCIITNEGNGRMVTTIPPVHIALMGMERLVPNLDDLTLMLSLLPRSATGQKLTVYTQLLHKPLANQTRHLIILDNGRTRLRNSPLRESLYCIRCGACLNACPVFRELSGHAYIGADNSIAPYPGPIGSVISPGLLGENYVQLAQASSLCGACKEVCPVDIDLPKLLTRVRAGQATKEGKKKNGAGLSPLSKFFMRIYSRVARNPRLFAVSQRLAAAGTHLVSPFSNMFRIPAFTGWGYSKDFPRFASRPFRSRWKNDDSGNGKSVNWDIQQVESQAINLPTDQSTVSPTDSFTAELTALGGHVTQTKNVTGSIIEFLKSRGIDRIHLEPNTLDESILQKAGITSTNIPDTGILSGATPHFPVQSSETCGVTKAICGLADTGSILIVDGEGSPLHASLLPEIHLAVLKKSDILPSLPDAMDLIRDKSAAVFITGASRTADIEMTLTIGVHGPGEVHVFLVDDSMGQ